MRKDELKQLLQKYQNGTLNKEEEQKIEELLESFDVYNEFLHETLHDEGMKEADLAKMMKKAQQKFFFRNTLLVVSFILTIVPLLTMFTFVYYGWGREHNRGNEFIETIQTVSEMTAPNVYVDYDTVDDEIKPFTMIVTTDKYKWMDDKKIYLGKDTYKLFFNNVFAKESNYRAIGYSLHHIGINFIHPKAKYFLPDERTKIESLPRDWPVEIYISLNQSYSLKEINEKFKGYHMTWLALDTGVEEQMRNDLDFIRTPAIGFPYKKVHVDSVFNRSFTDYEEVVKGLELLSKNEKWATQLTEYKDLKMAERLKWVKKHKELKIYGIAMTGTAKDVLSLEKMKEVNVIRLGQIHLP
ncbi:putative anti-sigma-M factor YhdL [Parageobacillus thermoglucosidasius]|uniref:anti-sigma factor n=1 Tax=Parageobacillus thermoglucosidasius TaxID=1426 RepID=UPI000F61B3A3|nr:anti-sigma factor [Parageobacillus thermoglucosidasius]GCD82648.1 putative anti-sigma-M factor YhdL [Parageobacillus thermoglucosidasius]